MCLRTGFPRRTTCLVTLTILSLLIIILQRNNQHTDENLKKPVAGFILKPKTAASAAVPGNGGIPRIIHQTWKTCDVPYLLKEWVQSCISLHQENWQYWFWTDADAEAFIKQLYPQYYGLYMRYPGVGYRTDMFRYLLLYEYGGVYLDLDMECLQAFDFITYNYTCLVAQEPLLHAHFLSPLEIPLLSNAFMACQPKHPFFKHIIEMLPKQTGWISWNDVLTATGPYMLTQLYKSLPVAHAKVHVAEPEMFNPTSDKSMHSFMQDACVPSAKEIIPNAKKEAPIHAKLCQEILDIGFLERPNVKRSYTNHHWTHLWAGDRNDPWGVGNTDSIYNVCQLNRNN